MVVTNAEHRVEERLGDSGIRFTGGRRRVVSALLRAAGPVSAAELHRRLSGEVPVSTLYRTLSVLEDAGVVEPHHSAKGVTRYEIAQSLAGHHHHLVCGVCGAVEDIELTPELEDRLERLVASVASAARFQVDGHSLEVDGRCRRCR